MLEGHNARVEKASKAFCQELQSLERNRQTWVQIQERPGALALRRALRPGHSGQSEGRKAQYSMVPSPGEVRSLDWAPAARSDRPFTHIPGESEAIGNRFFGSRRKTVRRQAGREVTGPSSRAPAQAQAQRGLTASLPSWPGVAPYGAEPGSPQVCGFF